MGAGVEQVGAPLGRVHADRLHAVEHVGEQRRAVDHRGVDHLALARTSLASSMRAHDAEGEEHRAAAEVADEVERADRAGRRALPIGCSAPASAM